MQMSEVLKAIRPCDMEQPYIFVSYSARDYERVWQDVLRFQQMGYNVWLDEKNLDKKQDSWRTEALDAIRDLNCSLLVFYVSRHSLVSQHCFAELSCTVESYTKAVHFGAVKFVAVDVEPIADIVEFSGEIYAEIRSKNISKTEKTTQAVTLNNCIEQFFNSNNEKVRVKPYDIPNRKMDYYEEISAAFPDDTRVFPVENTMQPTVDIPAVSEPPVVAVEIKEVREEPVGVTENAAPIMVEKAPVAPAPKKPYDLAELGVLAIKEANRFLIENDDDAYGGFLLANELTPKQLNGAVAKIAKGEKKEDIIGMRDESIFKSGKSGIVLTKTTLYSSWAKKHPVDLQTLKRVSVLDDGDCDLLLEYESRFERVFFNTDYLLIKAILQVYVDANHQK